MRQAGRYLPEYRRLRELYSLLEMAMTPDLAAEVTLQPLRRFDLDAAIIFADILLPLIGLGLEVEFVPSRGPVIHNPIRRPADVDALRQPSIHGSLGSTFEAIGIVCRELGGRVPLIGFAGAPFTLASYAIEGGPTQSYLRTKGLMYEQPLVWQSLMTRLAETTAQYLVAQQQAGAQVLQVFDSWAGALSPRDYRQYVLPYSRLVISSGRGTGVPVIHFTTGTAGWLPLVHEAGGDVLSIDWRTDLAQAWHTLGHQTAIQGNLDPAALTGPWPEVRTRVEEILRQAAGRAGHIFNLGHGVLPETDPHNVAALVDFVHTATMAPSTHQDPLAPSMAPACAGTAGRPARPEGQAA
jgi:uroporphyrinogen decarboxylase